MPLKIVEKQKETVSVEDLTSEQLEQLYKEKKDEERKDRKESREAYENMKDETLKQYCEGAKTLQETIRLFRKDSFSDIESLVELLREHSKRYSDVKGNYTFETTDSKFKIKYSSNRLGKFDERSEEAIKHIKEFLSREFKKDSPARKLIFTLLERNKDQLDIKQIQKLYAMEDDYTDTAWVEGIRLLKESWQDSGTKQYINFYEKDDQGKWQHISLNFSAL